MDKEPPRTARLTKRTVDAAHPEPARYTLWDTDLRGFGLRVAPTGTKTYLVRYRAGGGRSGTLRQLMVGRHGPLTADQARDEAVGLLAKATLGEDPQADKATQRKELTVADLCNLYVAEGCTTKKASTLYTDKGRIERHIKPLLGKLKVSAVTQAHIEGFLSDVAEGKTATTEKTKKRGKAVVRGGRGAASRTVGLLGGVFQFAVSRKMRPDNPVRGVKRFRDGAKERFLSPKELGALGAALADAQARGENPKALAIIRLLALTGARKGEVVGLRWSEIDHNAGCLRLGDSKTGAKIIPLGAPAMLVLDGQKRTAKSPFVFPAEGAPERAFQGVEKVWLRVRKVADLDDVRLHDLRHSFASAAVAGGSSLPLIGKLLGHADVKTTSKYAHLGDDPVKAAAEQVSGVIAGALSGASADVLPIRKGGRS